MTFNPAEFHQRVRDFSHPEFFLVSFPDAFEDAETLSFLTESTSLPGRTIGVAEIVIQKVTIKMADALTFDDWTCTFRAERLHRVRNQFMKWNSDAVNAATLTRNPPAFYKKNNVWVAQLDSQGNVIDAARFIGLWPSAVGELTLGHAEDFPQTFEVTFSYDMFQVAAPEESNLRVDINIDAGGIMVGSDLDVDIAAQLDAGIGSISLSN